MDMDNHMVTAEELGDRMDGGGRDIRRGGRGGINGDGKNRIK